MAPRRTTGEFRKTELKNGLRIVTETLPAVRSVSLGVWIDVGSRNESASANGVSHLIEHMVFKGTPTRNARDIASGLEALGGALNGWTSREHTCYTARCLGSNLSEAVDILADITCRPTLTAHNLAREKLVISEEIKESLDNPSDKIHDQFARAYWGDHPLGYPIMGNLETIGGMTRRRMLEYYRQNYRSASTLIAACGNVSHARLVRLVKERFTLPGGDVPAAHAAHRSNFAPRDIRSEDSAQTHVCVGYPALPYGHKWRMVQQVLGTYLGGGMSSVLFQKIREQRGLAYAVYTYNDFYRDDGILGAYLGTDATSVGKALSIIDAEVARLKKRRLTSDRLDQIKTQLKGHVTISLESTQNRMNRIARLELLCNRFASLRQTMSAIDAVTASQVMELANKVFDNDERTLAVLGPVSEDVAAHAA